MSKFSKLFYGALFALPSVMLAEGETGGASTFDLTAAGTAATQIATAVAGLLTGAVLTGLLAVYGGRVTLWVITRLASWVGAGKK